MNKSDSFFGGNKNILPVEKTYTHVLENKTKLKLMITCELTDYHADDFRRIISAIASDARNFYLGAATELKAALELAAEKETARELADMIGNKIVECGVSLDVLTHTAHYLTEDYRKIMQAVTEMKEEGAGDGINTGTGYTIL